MPRAHLVLGTCLSSILSAVAGWAPYECYTSFSTCSRLPYLSPQSAPTIQRVLDRPEEAFSYGQPLHDNVLLFPLDARPARDKIDGLLIVVPSATSGLLGELHYLSRNSILLSETACCSGRFLAFLRKPFTGGMRLYGPFNNHRYVQTEPAVVQGMTSV